MVQEKVTANIFIALNFFIPQQRQSKRYPGLLTICLTYYILTLR